MTTLVRKPILYPVLVDIAIALYVINYMVFI